MLRNKKALLLFVLVAVSAALSLACGGGGGSDSSSAVGGDFEGSWHFSPEGKADRNGAFELWFNVLSDGSVEPEPPEIGTDPRVTGGSVVLDNADTGEFHGMVYLYDSSRPTEVITISFAGTLNAEHDAMDVHFAEWDVDGTIEKVAVREPFVGRYMLDLKQQLRPEDTNSFFYGVAVVDVDADGGFAIVDDEEEIAGTWSVFRGQHLVLQDDWDEDDDGTPETHFIAALEFSFPLLVGGPYYVVSPHGTIKGVAFGFFTSELPEIEISAFGGPWNIVFQDDEDSVPEGVIGLLINDDGTVPSQLVGDLQVAGSITEFDGTSGAFTMQLTVQDEGGTYEHTYRGFISPFGNRIYATEYTLVGDELEETGEIRLFKADAFEGPDLDGYWSLGTTPGLGSDAMKVLNLRAQDGYLYLDSSMSAEPVGVVFYTDYEQVSFFLDFDLDDEDGVLLFAYSGIPPSPDAPFSDTATILIENETTVEYYKGYLGEFDPSGTADGNLMNYSGIYHLLGGDEEITVVSVTEGTETRLEMYIGGTRYDVVWDDRNLLLFHLHNDTLGDYADGAVFFLIPDSIAVQMDEWGFADPEGIWANLPADE